MTQAETFIIELEKAGTISSSAGNPSLFSANKCTGHHHLAIDKLRNGSHGHKEKQPLSDGGVYPELYWFKDLSQIFITHTFTDYLLKVNQQGTTQKA